MSAFALGFACSLCWGFFLVPIFLIKTAFTLPLE